MTIIKTKDGCGRSNGHCCVTLPHCLGMMRTCVRGVTPQGAVRARGHHHNLPTTRRRRLITLTNQPLSFFFVVAHLGIDVEGRFLEGRRSPCSTLSIHAAVRYVFFLPGGPLRFTIERSPTLLLMHPSSRQIVYRQTVYRQTVYR